VATNPIGKGTKTIGVNIPIDLDIDLRNLAKQSSMGFSEYCRAIFLKAREEGLVMRHNYTALPNISKPLKVAQSTGPDTMFNILPKINAQSSIALEAMQKHYDKAGDISLGDFNEAMKSYPKANLETVRIYLLESGRPLIL